MLTNKLNQQKYLARKKRNSLHSDNTKGTQLEDF